jgi:hypothetical protein
VTAAAAGLEGATKPKGGVGGGGETDGGGADLTKGIGSSGAFADAAVKGVKGDQEGGSGGGEGAAGKGRGAGAGASDVAQAAKGGAGAEGGGAGQGTVGATGEDGKGGTGGKTGTGVDAKAANVLLGEDSKPSATSGGG